MKKVLFFLVLCLIGGYIFYTRFSASPTTVSPSPTPTKLLQKDIVPFKNERLLFVPYWALSSIGNQASYDSFIYFGITSDDHGINTSEVGYVDIPQYTSHISASKTLLTVRMTDKALNEKVLESPDLQQKIISDSLHIVHTYGFKGIMLDFEIGGIGFDSVTHQVSNFIVDFSHAAKKQGTFLAVSLYADTFYRARPYDIKTLAANSDQIIVMAYDFHKAGGDPGPNFPFAESDADGYSFPQMVTDFLQDVPKKKLTIAFGMFGYDWPVTEKGDSISTATPLSAADIQASFINSCKFSSCRFHRNSSDEPSISYTDKNQAKHIIWFEDSQSVSKKIEYLKTQGIGSVAFWANSYF